MAEIQDSSGIPLSGPLSQAQINKGRMQRWISTIAAKVFAEQIKPISEQIRLIHEQMGEERAEARRAFQDMALQISSLQQQVEDDLKANHDENLRLYAAYNEYREWGDQVAASVAEAEADTKTIEHTMERVDGIVEIAQVLLIVLEPTSRGINWLIDRLHKLTPRQYSQSDGADITGLVRKPRRRASDRTR